MTIHVGADRADAAKNGLGAAARECKLIGLKPLRIDQSNDFIKTLFVQFDEVFKKARALFVD